MYWNFLETSHGKGPADGIGATIKCTADRMVAHGTDILDCTSLMHMLDGKVNVQLYVITSEQIDDKAALIQQINPQPVKGIAAVHQLICLKRAELRYRNLSCYCENCKCHNLKYINLNIPAHSELYKHQTNIDESQNEVEKRLTEAESETEMLTEVVERPTKTDESPSEAGNERSNRQPDKGSESFKANAFYAVAFVQRKNKKRFYIGRLTRPARECDPEIEMTFLEQTMIDGKYRYDWPRREDILEVYKSEVLTEVQFDGRPPYMLSLNEHMSIEKLM